MKTYKIRSFQNGAAKSTGKGFQNYSITIPAHIAEALPAGMTFAPELTEDGLLFRPAVPEAEQVVLPAWAANGSHSNDEAPAEPEAEKAPAKTRPTRQRPSRSAA